MQQIVKEVAHATLIQHSIKEKAFLERNYVPSIILRDQDAFVMSRDFDCTAFGRQQCECLPQAADNFGDR